MRKWTRRAFIGAGTLAGGGLVLGVAGVTFAPNRLTVLADEAAPAGDSQLTTWLLISPDNYITVLIPHCEMGQGAQTALAMMAAEELDADWTRVRVQEAPATDAYASAYIVRGMVGDVIPGVMNRAFDYSTYRLARWYGLQVTGGSTSIRGTGVYGMTVAGAAAREMLVAAAAKRFGVSPIECRALGSQVIHDSSKRSASFGELAADAAKIPVPSRPTLKNPNTYILRGTPRPRFDIPSKVDGSAIYGIDFKVPGMLYAAISIAPAYGGTLTSVDSAPAEAMPGVKKVVRLTEAVAVVADSYWHAKKGLAALTPAFDDGGNSAVSTASIFSAFDTSLGAAADMPKEAAKVVTADYKVPFVAHATMEPMVCTAKVENGRADIWAGTQDPLNARATAAKALGFDVDQVHVTNFALGGGFGRRLPGNLDYVDIGARIAQAMSPTPVKLIWSRENDLQHDYYRPAGMMRFAGALDANGQPLAIKSAYAGGGDGESTFMPYAIETKEAKDKDATHPIRTGPWRSVLNSQHGFFKESFVDEMAHAAGKDPFEFRRDLCTDQPRFKALLEKAAAMSGWGTPLPEGEGRGIAVAESFGSIACHVAQVAVDPDGTLHVRKVFSAIDCGDIVNPDTATAQIEGGVVFGLSAALYSEITIAEGRVVEKNFDEYPMIHIKDVPEIEVAFIRSNAPLGGLGEPSVPPVAPAVANAIFAATGTRLRELPLMKHKLTRRATTT